MSWLASPFKFSSVALTVAFWSVQHLEGRQGSELQVNTLSRPLDSAEDALQFCEPKLPVWMEPHG